MCLRIVKMHFAGFIDITLEVPIICFIFFFLLELSMLFTVITNDSMY